MTQTGGVAEGRLSDSISLGVLASWVPRDAVDEAVEATGKGAKRKGGKLDVIAAVFGEDYSPMPQELCRRSWRGGGLPGARAVMPLPAKKLERRASQS